MAELMMSNTRVEVPYIAVKIGDYSFGVYNRTKTSIEANGRYYSAVKVDYPNYIQSLSIQKVNGQLNTYNLVLDYPITETSDPNLIDKILSSVSQSRKIIFTYGDCALPTFMYCDEEALITKVSSNADISSSKITYTITAVSAALGAQACIQNYPKYQHKKPSDVMISMLRDKSTGLQEIFYGMHNVDKVLDLGLIPRDDREVTISAKRNISSLDYLNYLVGCMSNKNDSNTEISKTVRYVLTVQDDTSNVLDGPYFKISKVYNTVQPNTSIDYYTIDIGYPNKDLVSSFRFNDNEAYAMLYKYSEKLSTSESVYRINQSGQVEATYSPSLTSSRDLMITTEADKTWWSQMTQYPIQATLTIKGLLRAAMLMSYIRVNVYFYGKKYAGGSGVYIVNKQVDEISSAGYKTTLNLVRVQGDIQ